MKIHINWPWNKAQPGFWIELWSERCSCDTITHGLAFIYRWPFTIRVITTWIDDQEGA